MQDISLEVDNVMRYIDLNERGFPPDDALDFMHHEEQLAHVIPIRRNLFKRPTGGEVV